MARRRQTAPLEIRAEEIVRHQGSLQPPLLHSAAGDGGSYNGLFRFLLAAFLGEREALGLFAAGCAFPDVVSALTVSHKTAPSLFHSRVPSCFRLDACGSVSSQSMAKPNYSGEKRRRELEKQKKKEEKKRRKLENASRPAEVESFTDADEQTEVPSRGEQHIG
jgi:hypothetical protein